METAVGEGTFCPRSLHFTVSWAGPLTAPGVGFTVYYAKQNVTSSLFARPGSSLKAANNRGPASCEGGRGLPCPLRAARAWRADLGVVPGLPGRRAWPAASPVSHGCAGARPDRKSVV